VDNGDRALERLRALAAGDRSSFPSLVLLDLNLPCVSGTELISFASRDPVLKDLPIAILTSSEAPADRAHCESAGCVAYFVKPTSLQGYRVLLRDICSLLSELHGPLKSK
jgi:CheY-like chemotaxis protein